MVIFGQKLPEMTFLVVFFAFLTTKSLGQDPRGFRGLGTRLKTGHIGNFLP